MTKHSIPLIEAEDFISDSRNVKNHSKSIIEDKEFISDVCNVEFSQKELRRLFAVNRTFTNVSFKQAELSQCYFRNCHFIRCDFTGANIAKCNFRGSQYEECKFSYTTWEHTYLEEEILSNCLPSEGNLARDLIRALRVNFGHIGNYPAVNKTASIEVTLTGKHWFNATYSKQSYYRAKYKGWNRVTCGVRHLKWAVFNLLWGNGESFLHVFVSGIILILMWPWFLPHQFSQFSWPELLWIVIQAFWGITTSPPMPAIHLVILTFLRFVLFGLFMAIFIKRLSQR